MRSLFIILALFLSGCQNQDDSRLESLTKRVEKLENRKIIEPTPAPADYVLDQGDQLERKLEQSLEQGKNQLEKDREELRRTKERIQELEFRALRKKIDEI